ncbi:hypothetical protein NKH77_07340 [Streptomyces sp. M19]
MAAGEPRPSVYNSALEIDDNTAWEFLFDANRTNFGYVDIDCFVLEPEVFSDLASFDEGVAVNAIWTYQAAPGVPIGCTHLVFLNAAVIAELRARKRYLSPANHDWHGSRVPLLHHRTYCRIPTASQRRLLLEVLPADEHGRPRAPAEAPFFDTLVGYQIAAAATGTGPTRCVRWRTGRRTCSPRPPPRRTGVAAGPVRRAGARRRNQLLRPVFPRLGIP